MNTSALTGRCNAALHLLLVLAMLLAGGCAAPQSTRESDSVFFWHDWEGADAELLNHLLARYAEANASKHVVETALAPGLMASEFAMRFAEGTEPDMLLTDAATAQELIQLGYIKDLTGLVDTSSIYEPALSFVRAGDHLYGLPFTISTQVLFYNREHLPDPPANFTQLVEQIARPGFELGLNTQFQEAYWGLRLFGAKAYDQDGRIQMDRGAITNWLTELKNIQSEAGFVLSNDQDQLRQAFVDEIIEMYVADAKEHDELQGLLGDKLGVTRLPVTVAGNPAGPLLQGTVLLISQNAGNVETERALHLAGFLTNPQQQVQFTQSSIGRLPANKLVRISPAMLPIVVELSKQIRSAVPIALDQRDAWDKVAERSQTLYRAVLEGLADIYSGVAELESILDAELGQGPQPMTAATVCPSITPGRQITLTLWHGWTDADAALLEQMQDEFHTLCPEITIVSERVAGNNELYARYRAAASTGGGPDILVDSTQWTAALAQDGLIRSLNDSVDIASLSEVVPSAIDSLRYEGRLYGYPESARSLALIYNPTLVPDPPQTLDDLLLAVDLTHQFAMPLSYFYGYWGLSAFGGRTFDDDQHAVLDQGGMVEWLQWLRDANARPGFAFTTDRSAAEQRFIDREAAFLISGSWSLPVLYAAMPREEVAVAMLPAGPVKVAGPMLEVEAFMLNPQADDDTVAAALAFAAFVTSQSNEQRLMATGVHVPANVTVDAGQEPNIAGFRTQTHTAVPVTQDRRWDVVFAYGDDLYRDTVLGDLPPAEAVSAFTKLINETNAMLP